MHGGHPPQEPSSPTHHYHLYLNSAKVNLGQMKLASLLVRSPEWRQNSTPTSASEAETLL